jgi:hypothetical protein
MTYAQKDSERNTMSRNNRELRLFAEGPLSQIAVLEAGIMFAPNKSEPT